MKEEWERYGEKSGNSGALQFPEDIEFNLSDFALFLSVVNYPCLKDTGL